MPLARGRYVMSLTHTRLVWVGRGWSSIKSRAQRCPWVESVVRGAKALGCKARRPWRRSPVRKVWRPNSRTRPAGAGCRSGVCGGQKSPLSPFLRPAPRAPPPPSPGAAAKRSSGWHHAQYLAQLLDGVVNALLVNEGQQAHGVGGCEKMAMPLFKISSSYISRLMAVRRARTSAASAGSAGLGYPLPLVRAVQGGC